MPTYKHGSGKYGTGSLYQRGKTWWVSYYVDSTRVREASESADKSIARKLLQQRLGQVAEGRFIGPTADRTRFEELAEDLLKDYRANGRKSTEDAQRRIALHLAPYFRLRRAHSITSADVKAYIAHRQE